MKKFILIFIFGIVLCIFSYPIKGQNYACINPDPAPGNTLEEQALNTYWHYRYRLIHYFEVIGGKPGMSIPADARNGADDSKPNSQIYWSDGGRLLGWYLMMLATEYRLLADNGQSTNETVMELYNAIHAAYRLDSDYMVAWLSGGNSVNVNFNNYQIFPGVGIMQDNDVALLYPNTVGGIKNYVSQFDPLNGCLQSLNSPGPNNYATCFGDYVCEFGDGKVGPVNQVQGEGFSIDVESKDNYISLLMGLAMVVKLVDPGIQGYIGCPNPYQYSMGPKEMANALGITILNYIMDECDFDLQYPNNDHIGAHFDKWDFTPYDVPLTALGNLIFNHPYYPAINPIYWLAQNPCINDPGGIQNLEMAIECAAIGNNGAFYGNPCSMISVFGNQSLTGAENCFGSNKEETETTGWDLCYSAINAILWDVVPCTNSLCDMKDILSGAPFNGPFCHSPDFGAQNGSNFATPDYASCGWASSRRFMFGELPGTPGNAGECANYNGLDFMVFYNLYYLISEQENRLYSVYINNLGVYPIAGRLGYFGDISSPFDYNNCAYIQISGLNVLPPNYNGDPNAGEVNITGGPYGIDFKPSGNSEIHIWQGANFTASCPNYCCYAWSPWYYTPQTDPYGDCNGEDQGMTRKNNGDSNNDNYNNQMAISSNKLPPYMTNSEFAAHPTVDGIINYPNPFQTTTTFNFDIKENTDVTITIYDALGRKIMDLINNKNYNQGSYAINFNGSDLASGNYTVVLQTFDDRKTVSIIKVN